MNIDSFVARLPSIIAADYPAYRQVIDDIGGMSTPVIMALLSAGVKELAADEIYCEVGCYHGCTLIGALLDNSQARAVAIDNFSEFTDYPDRARELLMTNLNKYQVLPRVDFHDQSFQNFFSEADPDYLPCIGVYFYDGCHAENDELAGLEMVLPFLADNALIFIDDIATPDVIRAMLRFGCSHLHNLTPLFLSNVAKLGDPLFWFGIGIWQYTRNPR
jgi:hypothetical protein